MTYSCYTHNYIVKNSNEVLQNAELVCDQAQNNIHSLAELSSFKASSKTTILIPGFINLHCHLAYNKLKLKSQSLFAWVRELGLKTFAKPDFSPGSNVLDGIDDLLKYGTTFVVENSFYPQESYQALKERKMKALIGIEVFGSNPDQAQEILQEKISLIESFEESAEIDFCFSPHAVYDVSKELWQACLKWSKENNKMLLSHIAESKAEEAFMMDLSKPELSEAKKFWQSINTLESKEKYWTPYESSVDFLKQNKLLDESLLLAHGVYCRDIDLKNLSEAGVKLINCPRSNEFLQNGKADTKKWQDFTVDFAMGTDSKASNKNLDLRQEIAQNTHLSSKEKFNKLTIDAAKILGRDQDIGSLELGKAADFVVLELIDENTVITPDKIFDLILDPQKTRVREVYINNSNLYSHKP